MPVTGERSLKKNTSLLAGYETCIRATEKLISPSGYSRKGAIFRHWTDGNLGLVQFQKAKRSTSGRLEFTVNLGIVCGRLFEEWQGEIEKADVWDAHLRTRLGALMPERRDKWWLIDDATDTEEMAEQISILVRGLGIPYLEDHIRTADLITLWQSERSPGATEVQRMSYLSMLAN